MISFGLKSKFSGNLSKSLFQVVKRGGCGVRGYVEQKGDEDIKWQWSVRESPCQECHKVKAKKGWFARLFRRKKEDDELTNRHKEVVYKPKIWELEYYSYLLPDCEKKMAEAKAQYKAARKRNKYVCGIAESEECEGKKVLVHLSDDFNDLKSCTEKLKFELKEPFSLNEVCGKMKHCKRDKKDEKSDEEKDNEFCCLNHLIENKENSEEDNSKKSQCS